MKLHKNRLVRKPHVRTQLIVSLTGFLALGLLLMFLFQTFFLDDLYELSKIHTVKTATNEIAQAVTEDKAAEYADYWSVREDCEVYFVDADGEVLETHGIKGGEAHRLTRGELRAFYDAALTKGGTVFSKNEVELGRYQGGFMLPPKENKPGGDREPPSEPNEERRVYDRSELSERVVYAVIVQDPQTSEPMLVLVTAMLTPVNATIRVIQTQFVISAVLFVGLAAVLAWFTAKRIASPIVDINRAAKGLPKGTYQPPAEGGYREISELRDTLTVINGELRKSEQLQRELVANVSHDLRTPLTMIIGYSEAIRDLPGEDSAENIQVVIDEAKHLSYLVNDVLDLSKLQSGVESFDMTHTNLTEVLQDTVARLGQMVRKEGYTIELIADEEVTVSADEVRLSQIVYNLLSNALAYTGADKRVVIAQTVTETAVRVSFTDSGKGIPQEELSSIWLRYYQVHSHDKRRDTMNSGLGLSIVYALVQCHGGICGVDSEVGKGSTFWFELPRV